MRQFSVTNSKEKAFESKSTRLTLEKKVNELEIQIGPNSDEALLDEYNKSKNELENLYNYIVQKSIGMNMVKNPQNISSVWRKETKQNPI